MLTVACDVASEVVTRALDVCYTVSEDVCSNSAVVNMMYHIIMYTSRRRWIFINKCV